MLLMCQTRIRISLGKCRHSPNPAAVPGPLYNYDRPGVPIPYFPALRTNSSCPRYICHRRDQPTRSSTTIELNDFLGNDNGACSFLFSTNHGNLSNRDFFVLGVFKWDGKGFGTGAKDIRLIDRPSSRLA